MASEREFKIILGSIFTFWHFLPVNIHWNLRKKNRFKVEAWGYTALMVYGFKVTVASETNVTGN